MSTVGYSGPLGEKESVYNIDVCSSWLPICQWMDPFIYGQLKLDSMGYNGIRKSICSWLGDVGVLKEVGVVREAGKFKIHCIHVLNSQSIYIF